MSGLVETIAAILMISPFSVIKYSFAYLITLLNFCVAFLPATFAAAFYACSKTLPRFKLII